LEQLESLKDDNATKVEEIEQLETRVCGRRGEEKGK
jgi:hypothetical protein